ncbi:hypothetical protein GRJ2_001904000 [Grus japonensis]|uniref:Uncharacterized protein n=1 Tax=Grus japonensis TaxID=30415 RepID=A0ABC9XAF0_GRUJA
MLPAPDPTVFSVNSHFDTGKEETQDVFFPDQHLNWLAEGTVPMELKNSLTLPRFQGELGKRAGFGWGRASFFPVAIFQPGSSPEYLTFHMKLQKTSSIRKQCPVKPDLVKRGLSKVQTGEVNTPY